MNSGNDGSVPYLHVPESALTTLADFEALEDSAGQVQLLGDFDIPYGTLVWANDDDIAACLLPTESGSPLAQIGLLYLGSGMLDTVQEQAIGKADSFEIYDVRANSSGIVWTEANIMEGAWKIFAAPLTNGNIGSARQVDEGGGDYETPTLGVAGNRAFWQVIPKSTENPELTSKLMAAPFSAGGATCVFESPRRSGTPVYSTANSVVIAPRADTAGVYYQLLKIDAGSGDVADTLTLPQGMKPLEAGYGNNGFMFSFPDIYDYGDGISNLGTYTPLSPIGNGDYSDAQWFGFARAPSAAPAWANDLLIVKSTYSVCGVDLAAGTYFAIDVENGADTYGEYLASSGANSTFVTYTNIDHKPIGEEKIHACRVKVYKPLTAREREDYAALDPDEDELDSAIA